MSDWYPAESMYPSEGVSSANQQSSDAEPPLREGLPPTYAMRHDRHYVDELSSPSGTPAVRMLRTRDIFVRQPSGGHLDAMFVESVRRVGILQPLLVRRRATGYELIAGSKRLAAATTAGLTELPCRVCDVDDRGARELAEADDLVGRPSGPPRTAAWSAVSGSTGSAEYADLRPALTAVSAGLDAALACWALSDDRPGWSHAGTLTDLSRAEVQRTKRLVDGLAVLTEAPALKKAPVDVTDLIGQVCQGTAVERRLLDVELTQSIGTPVTVPGDGPLLSLALASWLHAMTALAEASRSPLHLALRLDKSETEIAVSSPALSVSAKLAARFFDASCLDRPGGCAAAVALAVTNRIVELHGGRAAVLVDQTTGCRVTLTLPV